MPTYVFEMSTDPGIQATGLHASWSPVARHVWAQVAQGGLNIPANSTVVVIAHGNGTEIGNEQAGMVDIDATTFLALIQSNMANYAQPAAIYISTCGPGIAEFAANVRIAAEQNHIWVNTHIYGHHDPVAGSIPPQGVLAWTQIFP